MAEFLFDKALTVLVVFELVLENLDERVMLVQGRLHFLLVSEDVGKASGEFCATFAVKDDLRSADVAVGYALLVHEIESSQDLLREVLQDRFWNSTDTLGEIINTPIRCVISDD